MPAAHVLLEELLATADPGATGALWRLEGAARQLDSNVVRVRPGTRGEAYVENDLDVLLIVVEGHGTLHRAGTEEELAPGTLVFVPRGERRAVSAGDDGLVYVTAHRRRPGMTIGRAPAGGTAEGGEAPCLLPRVCSACGRVTEEADARFCGRCGERLPGQTSGRP
ncbi:cupin domain-containing protein [Streptomyces sp. NPDC046939]|uniref:cupin domain-containing protein n=1 Tax=Streptomyces sp. NPDC046939 TaxID=3155376 RepID=UPI0033D2A9A0